MSGRNGYIKLHRKMLDWGWYQNQNVKDLFIHLLLIANFKESKFEDMTIYPGQIITSINSLSKGTKLSTRNVRTALEKLEKSKILTKQVTSRFTIITIENWELYQGNDFEVTSQVTSDRHASDMQVTSDRQHHKNAKNANNAKNDNNPPIVPPKGGKAEGEKAGTAKATSKPIASWEEIESLLVGFDDEFKDCYRDYMIMRKSIKKPLTMRAAKIGLGKLKRFSKGDAKVAIQIMEQSILNSWQDFYELERKGARKRTEEVNFTDFL